MKKKFVSIVASVLSALTVTTVPFATSAAENPANYTIKDYTTAENYYNRVVLSKAFQTSEDRAANGEMLQLPQYMLNRMTTDALAEAVLDYPYFGDIYAFDDVQMGFELMMDTFNGARALADRDDVASVLLDKYCAEEVLTDASSADGNAFRLTNMEVLMSQNFVTAKFSKKEKGKFVKTVASKAADRFVSPVYGAYTSDLVFDLTEKNSKDSGLLNDMQKVRDGDYGYGPDRVLTPKGTPVNCYYNPYEPLSQDEIDDANWYQQTVYPNVTKLREPTGKYNCHSYAWYKQTTDNIKWIPNPSMYWLDGSYKETSSIKKNRKVEYFANRYNTDFYEGFPVHSAIVYSKSGSTTTVESKWGAMGLYRHNVNYSPYVNCNKKYYC